MWATSFEPRPLPSQVMFLKMGRKFTNMWATSFEPRPLPSQANVQPTLKVPLQTVIKEAQ